MSVERCVVNNRIFLLGLDKLYREAMKRHERGELLTCARTVANVLQVQPADVPVEGYYAEDASLTEFFRLVRALQGIDEGRAPAVLSLAEFQRLLEITSAPLYGRPQYNGKLLPVGRDALSQAMKDTSPTWTIEGLTARANQVARETDEFSLVGLAARIQDVVVLAAVRETVVLYAEVVFGSSFRERQREYVWTVDEDLARQATRFVETFNTLLNETLPLPEPAHAERFWIGSGVGISGRCVRLGCNDSVRPVQHYHWAISRGEDGEFEVEEFWSPEVWTTERNREQMHNKRSGTTRQLDLPPTSWTPR